LTSGVGLATFDGVASEPSIERARELVAATPGELRVGRDPVNLPMVHHFCQALGDSNPAYLDEDCAATSARGRLVARPGMLQTWTMDAPREAGGAQAELLNLLDEAGYTSVVAVNYEHDYRRELAHGERINVRSSVEDLSEEKKTALGMGYFTTVKHEYSTDDGEVVGIGRMRLLKFRPPSAKTGPAGEPEEPTPRAAPVLGQDNRYFWEGVEKGELRIQRCEGCGVLRHPPQPICERCGSAEQGYIVASGRGHVYSFVVHHAPQLAGVRTPHTVLLVELAEGVRLVSELVDGAGPAQVRIGLPVACEMKRVPGGGVVPAFRPVEAGEES
jgi:uncharacterized OB-fold protein/acyl dehydratase